jgi:hypothetical protein
MVDHFAGRRNRPDAKPGSGFPCRAYVANTLNAKQGSFADALLLNPLEPAAFARVHDAGMLADAVRPNLNPMGDIDTANHEKDSADDFDCVGKHAVVCEIINPEITEPSQ